MNDREENYKKPIKLLTSSHNNKIQPAFLKSLKRKHAALDQKVCRFHLLFQVKLLGVFTIFF